ncbi:hypothetical protein GCM10023319_45020 [Nocardia iowensis]
MPATRDRRHAERSRHDTYRGREVRGRQDEMIKPAHSGNPSHLSAPAAGFRGYLCAVAATSAERAARTAGWFPVPRR